MNHKNQFPRKSTRWKVQKSLAALCVAGIACVLLSIMRDAGINYEALLVVLPEQRDQHLDSIPISNWFSENGSATGRLDSAMGAEPVIPSLMIKLTQSFDCRVIPRNPETPPAALKRLHWTFFQRLEDGQWKQTSSENHGAVLRWIPPVSGQWIAVYWLPPTPLSSRTLITNERMEKSLRNVASNPHQSGAVFVLVTQKLSASASPQPLPLPAREEQTSNSVSVSAAAIDTNASAGTEVAADLSTQVGGENPSISGIAAETTPLTRSNGIRKSVVEVPPRAAAKPKTTALEQAFLDGALPEIIINTSGFNKLGPATLKSLMMEYGMVVLCLERDEFDPSKVWIYDPESGTTSRMDRDTAIRKYGNQGVGFSILKPETGDWLNQQLGPEARVRAPLNNAGRYVLLAESILLALSAAQQNQATLPLNSVLRAELNVVQSLNGLKLEASLLKAQPEGSPRF